MADREEDTTNRPAPPPQTHKAYHAPGCTNTSRICQDINAMKRRVKGTALYVTTFWTQRAGSDTSGPLVAAAQRLVSDWGMSLDVHAVDQPLAFNDDYLPDSGEDIANSQAIQLRQLAASAYDDGGNPMRFPAIFTPLRGQFKPNTNPPQYDDPQEVGDTKDTLGWPAFAIIDSNQARWTVDRATLLHEMGHGAGLRHVFSERYVNEQTGEVVEARPDNATDLMCKDGPKDGRQLNIASARALALGHAYFARRPK